MGRVVLTGKRLHDRALNKETLFVSLLHVIAKLDRHGTVSPISPAAECHGEES